MNHPLQPSDPPGAKGGEGSPDGEAKAIGLWQAWRLGTLGFGLASLAVFGSWAFLGRWFYQWLGEAGAYLAWSIMFLGLGGSALHRLIPDLNRWAFQRLFAGAFMSYAVIWMIAWLSCRNQLGEVLGSLLGCFGMGACLCLMQRVPNQWLRVSLILFGSNLSGYFLGSWMHQQWGMPWGAVAWGLAYGLMFGGGIGPALWLIQQKTLRD